MTIRNTTPLSMAEATEYIHDGEDAAESEKELKKFIKRFVKLDVSDAKKLRQELQALDLIKLKPEYISKVIDFLPDDQESLNKIFIDVSLVEDETKKILDTIKHFK